ncbi:phage portal protein, partial [Sinorhizobium medicae]|nr:phage portal protein [Sinorhizobium medicae]
PDEVRRLEDMPPKGGAADQLWVSGDLYPIDMDPTLRKGVKTSDKTE